MANSFPPNTRDPAAFVRWVHRHHHSWVWPFTKRLASRYGDYSEAEDLIQDFYLHVQLKYEQVRNGLIRRGQGYLVTMIKNLHINRHRKQESRDRAEEMYTLNYPEEGTLYDLFSSLRVRSLIRLVRRHLNEQNGMIMQLYLEGYKSKEIAELLDMTENSVNVRISRSKKRLRVLLKDERFETV